MSESHICPVNMSHMGADHKLIKAAEILEKKAKERYEWADKMSHNGGMLRQVVETQANTYETIAKALRGEE